MSLRSARSDSKLVIYGASGIASPAHSLSATPTHLLETTPTTVDMINDDTRISSTHQSASDVRVGSIADVEHKSVSALMNERKKRRSSGGQSSNHDHRTSSQVSVTVEQEVHHHGDESHYWNKELHHQRSREGTPRDGDTGSTRRQHSMSPEYSNSPYRASTEHVQKRNSSSSPHQTSIEHMQRRMGSSSPHRSSTEHVQRKSSTSSPHANPIEHVQRKTNSDSPYGTSTEHVQRRLSSSSPHRNSREFVIRRVSGEYSHRPSGDISQESIHQTQGSQDRTTPFRQRPPHQNDTPPPMTSSRYGSSSGRHDYSHYQRYPTNGSRSPPWYDEQQRDNSLYFRAGHSNSRLQDYDHTLLEEEEGPQGNGPWYKDDTWKDYGNKRQHTFDHTHQWNGHTHNKKLETPTKMTYDQLLQNGGDGVYQPPQNRARSLPRDTTPERVEEEEEEEKEVEEEEPRKKRVIDPNHPARPKNRGPFRLSLQDSTFYDTTRQYRGGSARWPRHTTVSSISTSSLSQPSDLLGVS